MSVMRRIHPEDAYNHVHRILHHLDDTGHGKLFRDLWNLDEVDADRAAKFDHTVNISALKLIYLFEYVIDQYREYEEGWK